MMTSTGWLLTRRRTAPPRSREISALAALAVISLATACSGSEGAALAPERSGPPVGEPMLPDLAPAPPVDVHTKVTESGSSSIRFSSVLVNVGAGEFLLRARRDGSAWSVAQEVPYSTSGVESTPIDASMVWGGDGHDHWHIARVATYQLMRLDETGRVVRDDKEHVDSKIGFCFFDHEHELDRGPTEAVHSRWSCGEESDDQVTMGLSPGWGDTYEWALPGQSIVIDGLPDGTYRLRGEADAPGMFREATRRNNVTWVDLELSTRDGLRFALVVDVGPEPR